MNNHVWHVNGSNRCMFCGVNDLDNEFYGPYACTDREPLVWTSESHPVDDRRKSEQDNTNQRRPGMRRSRFDRTT